MPWPTKPQWYMIFAALIVVAGIVWSRFWFSGLIIGAPVWLGLVTLARLSDRKTS